MDTDWPAIVKDAVNRAQANAFPLSSDPSIGSLLRTLSASVPSGGRVLEVGTGFGVGTAWIVSGLMPRQDVEVITVDIDASRTAKTAQYPWPDCVKILTGNVLDFYPDLGQFDLIFADAEGGKWYGLDQTMAALRPGGMLLVDDMTPPKWNSSEHQSAVTQVRNYLLSHHAVVASELQIPTGAILCAKRFA